MSVYTKANIIQVPSGYKSGKLYSLVPSNGAADFSFSRSTVGDRVKSTGILEGIAINTPRLDYPLSGGAATSCPTLLLEPQRTNNITFSTKMESSPFAALTNTTLTGQQGTSPDGNNTSTNAATLVTQSGSSIMNKLMVGVSSGNNYSASIFVKKGDLSYFHFRANISYGGTQTTETAIFDLDNIEIDNIGSGLVDAKIEEYPNNWIRCTIIFTSAPAGSYRYIMFFSDVNTVGTGSGAAGTGYIWGMQHEDGFYSSSPIDTFTSAVTRNADFCNRDSLSSILNVSTGTIYVEAELFTPENDFGRLISLSDGTTANRLLLIPKTGDLLRVFIENNGATQVDQDVSISYGTKQKIAVSYSASQVRIYVNGTLAATDSTVNVFTALDRVNFADYDNNPTAEARIYNATYFDTELSTTEMADLTTL